MLRLLSLVTKKCQVLDKGQAAMKIGFADGRAVQASGRIDADGQNMFDTAVRSSPRAARSATFCGLCAHGVVGEKFLANPGADIV